MNATPPERNHWRSTRFRYAIVAGAFLAACFAFGVFAMPFLGQEPLSEVVAVALLTGIVGNGGVYTFFKTRENKTLIETNNHNGVDEAALIETLYKTIEEEADRTEEGVAPVGLDPIGK